MYDADHMLVDVVLMVNFLEAKINKKKENGLWITIRFWFDSQAISTRAMISF